MPSSVYFISDTHIREGDRTREERLLSFLGHIDGRARALYILGDLFDFWFEYRSVVPRTGWRTLHLLHELVLSGTSVTCIRGNHDLWLGPHISDVGIEVVDGPVWVRHQGRKLFLAHGDEFFREPGYRALRYVLRHPVFIELFNLIHPDLGALLARSFSRAARSKSSGKVDVVKEALVRTAKEKFEEGADFVMFGHLHMPSFRRFGRKVLVVLGDWISNFTYALLEDGEISLRRWERSS